MTKLPKNAEQAAAVAANLYESVLKEERAKFPESKFRTLFAPYFLGQQPIPENSDFYAAWIAIAGSPQSEVDIIDDQGNVVFTVPSIIDSSIINISAKTQFDDVAMEADLRYKRLKAEGDRFTEETVIPESKKLISGTTQAGERWEMIARYYGYAKPQPKTETTLNNTDDDLDYDI